MAERDDAAFADFAAAARARLHHAAYLICGDWHRASDVVQEALIRVYVAWPRIERRGAVYAYARKAVVSVAIDHSRLMSSREVPVEDDRLAGAGSRQRPDPDTGDHADGVGDREILMAALRQLSPSQRACIVLRYLEDASVTEVAGALGCSEGTVKSQTFKALQRLRGLIGDFDAPDVSDSVSASSTAGGRTR